MAVIELPRYRWNPSDRWNRLAARLRDDRGVGLVELLIALLVLNIGIFATLGAFTSGALALRRASHTSTATAIADQEVEALRNTKYADIGVPASQTVDPWPNSPDGRSYAVNVTLLSTGSQLTSGTYQGSGQVKVMQIKVTDDSDNKVLYLNASTFSRCTQAALNTSDTTPCQS